MAGRIRTIKPELLEDEKASALSDAAWRLFVSSWLLCDDHGRFRAGARYLAAMVWQDTGRVASAAEALAELARAGRVRVYQAGGDTYAEIPTWTKHQKVDHPSKERIPPPDPNDSGGMHAVSRKVSERLDDRRPTRARTGPPTSDHGPPTMDQQTGSAGSEPPGSDSSPPSQPAAALPSLDVPTSGPSPTEQVFAAYLEGWHSVIRGTRPPRLDTKRRRLIAARLQDFPLGDVVAAARGIWCSTWNLEQPGARIAPEIVFRDTAHVERYRDLGRAGASTPVPPSSPDVAPKRGAREPTPSELRDMLREAKRCGGMSPAAEETPPPPAHLYRRPVARVTMVGDVGEPLPDVPQAQLARGAVASMFRGGR